MDKIRTEQEIANEVLEDMIVDLRNGIGDKKYLKNVINEFERAGIDCKDYKKYLFN